MTLLPDRFRPLLRRLTWLVGTAVVYAILDRFAVQFQVEPGVSVLFPGTAAAVIACMHGGLWGAAGIFLGSLFNPFISGTWSSTVPLFAAINAFEGLFPWIVFRIVPGVTRDLSNLRSLALFILSGTIINTGMSSALGTSLVTTAESAGLISHQMVVWWIADFSAAVLIAMPTLAFADRPLRAISPLGDREATTPRYISGTLQVTAAIVILGWSASAFVRAAVTDQIESTRLAQQQRAFEARNAVNHLHSNFLRAATLQSDYSGNPSSRTLDDFEEARASHFHLLQDVDQLVLDSTPAAIDQFNRLREKTGAWFSQARIEISGRTSASGTAAEAHQLSREFLNLKSSIENADALEWTRFRETRRRLAAFHTFVDGLVFLILIVAFGMLIVRISRPLDQLSTSIQMLGSGSLPPVRHGNWPFMELRTLDHALSSAARELKQRETELRDQTREAIEAARHKSAFLAKMSHELRTPLNSIIGFSDLLRKPSLDNDERRLAFADNVGHSARLLLTMVDDLLEIEKLESGKVSVKPRRCDLREIIRGAASSIDSLVAEKEQDLNVELPEAPLEATVDAEKLTQVLIRLLMNASKFSPEGESIFIRASVKSGIAGIEIEDRGVGINPEDHERIFETFEQVYRKGILSQGAGLGLTVARRFTEAQGGTILVRNNPGRGSTFTVRIPTEGS